MKGINIIDLSFSRVYVDNAEIVNSHGTCSYSTYRLRRTMRLSNSQDAQLDIGSSMNNAQWFKCNESFPSAFNPRPQVHTFEDGKWYRHSVCILLLLGIGFLHTDIFIPIRPISTVLSSRSLLYTVQYSCRSSLVFSAAEVLHVQTTPC